jgi:hypothetical protein
MYTNKPNTRVHDAVFERFCDTSDGKEVRLVPNEEPNSTG